jgi:hypothetical protein
MKTEFLSITDFRTGLGFQAYYKSFEAKILEILSLWLNHPACTVWLLHMTYQLHRKAFAPATIVQPIKASGHLPRRLLHCRLSFCTLLMNYRLLKYQGREFAVVLSVELHADLQRPFDPAQDGTREQRPLIEPFVPSS